MMRRWGPWGLVLVLAIGPGARRVWAQGATLPEADVTSGARGGSMLGPSPGAGDSLLGNSPGAGAQPTSPTQESGGTLGGRPGPSFSRAPAGISTPGPSLFGLPPGGGVGTPPPLPVESVPLYGPLSLPAEETTEGPPEGLTLDAAIELLIRNNLDLRARFFEIPQAQADILTASLRANPIFYADAQLVPYGRYSQQRPGGQTQYDINVSHPLDVSRKRRARMLVATQAKRVIEAQFQDAVRLQIDNLYTAYVDVLAARETVRYAEASVRGNLQILDVTRQLKETGGLKTSAEVARVKILADTAQIGLLDAQEAYRRTLRTLAGILNLPPAEAGRLELHGTIADQAPPPPVEETLIQIALTERPDLAAYRLGVQRAQADVRLARANRLQDLYLLYQPYTFQDNTFQGLKSATSWALGVTVPLPLYNRNQGNIQRAVLNVSQTRTEHDALQRQIVTDVQQAYKEYAITREAVRRIRDELMPSAEKVLRDTLLLYKGGEVDVVTFLNAQRDYNDVVRQYRDTVVRHRRSMLRLNTALGRRILP